MLLQRAFSSQGLTCVHLLRQYNTHAMSSISYKVISERSDTVNAQNQIVIICIILVQFRRRLHVTSVNRDLETGLRALGAGVAATGVVGSGIGLGLIFGNLNSAIARNPSIGNKVFANAVMGAAFCESLGLFAMAIAFVIMP